MVTDEDMAVSFYRIGDAAHLAQQLIRILKCPQTQRKMAEQNFAAGLQMTMSNVVRNYLRWFRLHQAKKAIITADGGVPSRVPGRPLLHRNDSSPGWALGDTFRIRSREAGPRPCISEPADDLSRAPEISRYSENTD
jgi:hypothetical protein